MLYLHACKREANENGNFVILCHRSVRCLHKKAGAWFIFCDNVMNNALFLFIIRCIIVNKFKSVISFVRYRDFFFIIVSKDSKNFYLSPLQNICVTQINNHL